MKTLLAILSLMLISSTVFAAIDYEKFNTVTCLNTIKTIGTDNRNTGDLSQKLIALDIDATTIKEGINISDNSAEQMLFSAYAISFENTLEEIQKIDPKVGEELTRACSILP